MLCNCADEDLLAVIDAVLQLHSGWDEDPWRRSANHQFEARLNGLEFLLANGASMYRVDHKARHLVRRVDETVEEAADQAVRSAPTNEAAVHLAVLLVQSLSTGVLGEAER